LVAVKGGNPEQLFDTAILAMGGMGQFVKLGQTVVVKPNIGWDVPPERAANTNPRLIARIIAHCRGAGAKRVYVFDHTCDEWRRSYRRSGIQAAVERAGGVMAPGDGHGYFHPTRVGGRHLERAEEHELIRESDVFINVPVLKQHGSVGLSIAMKNLMGTVWDRGDWYRRDLHRCIADFATYRRPDLNVVDAYNVLLRNGPRGLSEEDVFQMRALLISTDMVSADTAATKLFGLDPGDVKYIGLAAAQGAGCSDLSRLAIRRIQLS
jgi:uncharacterized protein (DUF362 family)